MTAFPVAAIDILTAIRVANGTIKLDGDQLQVRVPGGIPEDLAAMIREHKTELVDHLSGLDRLRAERVEVTRRLDVGFPQIQEMEAQGQVGTPQYERYYATFDRLRCRLEWLEDQIHQMEAVAAA